MKTTKKQIRRIIKEEKAKLLNEQPLGTLRPEDRQGNTLAEVGGDQPVFHDAAMDEALNDYIEKFVDLLEDDIGESRGTMALLEVMKEHLVHGIKQGTVAAMRESGVRY